MAHGLETNGQDAAIALRGEPAWHGLGTVFDIDANISTSEMLKLAKLADWNVRLENLQFPNGYVSTEDKKYHMVLRNNPFTPTQTDILSVVGDRYRVLQNEELFTYADDITSGGAKWESAGSIKGGRVVFGSLAVPREFILDPQGANDKTVTYLLVHSSHDGSTSIQASITPVRVVCQNTLNMALQGRRQTFKIRHTSGVRGKVVEAREALKLTNAYMDDFSKLAKQLFEKEIDNKVFNDIIVGLYPKPDVVLKNNEKNASLTMWGNKIDKINDLYFNSPTNANIKGTLWGAFNALTERVDYYRQGRNDSKEGILSAASGFEPSATAEKNRILDAVMAQL